MITTEYLQRCADKLDVYDVKQSGWEHEPNGFRANAQHVLFHLVKALGRKSFNDPTEVRTSIVPDAMQYALRLGRWCGIEVDELLPVDGSWWLAVRGSRTHNTPLHEAALDEAATTLAEHLHDLDHASSNATAEALNAVTMQTVGRMLLVCAEEGAERFNFDPIAAFDERLHDLRRRFGIAEPVI